MIILTPIPVETKKALERGECVGQTIQESPWEVSVESVIGYEFVRDMQIKKTKIFLIFPSGFFFLFNSCLFIAWAGREKSFLISFKNRRKG